jgi:hypothetical protein
MTAARERRLTPMPRTIRGLVTTVLGLSVIAVVGCAQQKAPDTQPAEAPAPAQMPVEFKVSGVEVGREIDASKRIVTPTTIFGPTDTIYVSVATEGATPSATVSARWTYGDDGQLVNEMSETIAPSGPAATEFHITKPSGWPAGKYRVEVSVNGTPAGSKEFEVKT